MLRGEVWYSCIKKGGLGMNKLQPEKVMIKPSKDNKNYFFWKGDQDVNEHDFDCGYCGRHTSSKMGLKMFRKEYTNSQLENFGVYVCTHCNLPSFLSDAIQVPGLKYGAEVKSLSGMLDSIYTEARNSFSSGAYTGVVLLCRKLLMHIAVELGAKTNLRFIEYVNYLEKESFITARSKDWVDSIRQNGNSSTHQIEIATKEEAERMIKFSEMILKTNFEYPAELKSHAAE